MGFVDVALVMMEVIVDVMLMATDFCEVGGNILEDFDRAVLEESIVGISVWW